MIQGRVFFIFDKSPMAGFGMCLSTSVGCWLMAGRTFLYLPDFSLAFPQCFVLGLL